MIGSRSTSLTTQKTATTVRTIEVAIETPRRSPNAEHRTKSKEALQLCNTEGATSPVAVKSILLNKVNSRKHLFPKSEQMIHLRRAA